MSVGIVRGAALCTLLVCCSGCGYLFGDEGVFRDKSEDYKKAPEVPVLQVPRDKNGSALHEIYAIPPVDEKLVPPGKFAVPRPEPLVAGAAVLQRDAGAGAGLGAGQIWCPLQAGGGHRACRAGSGHS